MTPSYMALFPVPSVLLEHAIQALPSLGRTSQTQEAAMVPASHCYLLVSTQLVACWVWGGRTKELKTLDAYNAPAALPFPSSDSLR